MGQRKSSKNKQKCSEIKGKARKMRDSTGNTVSTGKMAKRREKM